MEQRQSEVDSFFFLLLNSNKRSIVVDLKAVEGKEIARRLIKECDVVARISAPASCSDWGSATTQ